MNWSLYEAFGDAISFAPIESIASDFGISPQAKTTKVPVAIIVDVFVFAYGMVMGPMWNKGEWLMLLRDAIEAFKDSSTGRLLTCRT
jgi:hypothetical protein